MAEPDHRHRLRFPSRRYGLHRTAPCVTGVIAALAVFSCSSLTEEPETVEPAGAAAGEVPPAVVDEPPEEEVYTAMSEAMALGKVDEAIAAFEDAYSAGPEDAESKILYANLLILAGKTEEARVVLEEVLQEEPENTEALFNLSLLEGSLENRKKQEAILRSIVEIDPYHARALAALGELQLAAGRLDPARESFEKALTQTPANIVALMGYGNVLLRKGEPAAAEEQFDKVIERLPDYIFAYVDRSRARRDGGDYSGAEEDLNEVIRLDPDYYWHYIDRGRLRLLNLGDSESALADFNRAIEIDPDYFYAYVFRGGIHDRSGEIAQAVEDYLKVLEARPDYYHLYAPVGVILYAQDRFQEARKYLKMAYESELDEHFYAFLIALSYRKEGLDSELEAYLRKAIAGFPRDSLYYQLARIFFESGADAYVTAKVSGEKNLEVKFKSLFVLATFYLLEDRPALAQKYFLEVEDKASPYSHEKRLSTLELGQYRGVRSDENNGEGSKDEQ